jgi:hypothetical protein
VIRVTYVLGCHDSQYTKHYKLLSVDGAQQMVDEEMAKDHFYIEVVGGYIRIYPRHVSAIIIRDITHEENIRKEALVAQKKGA